MGWLEGVEMDCCHTPHRKENKKEAHGDMGWWIIGAMIVILLFIGGIKLAG